jgi:hypothetical protein
MTFCCVAEHSVLCGISWSFLICFRHVVGDVGFCSEFAMGFGEYLVPLEYENCISRYLFCLMDRGRTVTGDGRLSRGRSSNPNREIHQCKTHLVLGSTKVRLLGSRMPAHRAAGF